MPDHTDGGHFRTDAPDAPPAAAPRRWLPLLGLVVFVVASGFVASLFADDDDPLVVGSGSDGTDAATAPVDGTFSGEFTESYFAALSPGAVTENRLFVTVDDTTVVGVTGGWVATDVAAQTRGDEVLCRATYAASHDLVEPGELVDGRATVTVAFELSRSDFVPQPALETGECDETLREPLQLVRTADVTIDATTGSIQFFDTEGAERGLVVLTQ